MAAHKNSIKRVKENLTAWFLFIPSLAVLIPVTLILLVYRNIVYMLSVILRPDLLKIVQGLDVAFSVDKFWTRPKGATSFIWIFDGPLNPTLVKSRFSSVFEKSDKLTSCESYNYEKLTSVYPVQWLGYSFWRKCDQQFNMENHLKLLKVPEKSGEKFSDLTHLNQFIASYMRQGFTQGLPLWQVALIPSFMFKDNAKIESSNNIPARTTQCNERSILILKIHHMIGDGYSKLRLLEKIVDDIADKKFVKERNKKDARTIEICNKDLKRLTEIHKAAISFRKWIQDTAINLLFLPQTLKDLTKDFVFHSNELTSFKSDSEIILATTNIEIQPFRQIRQNVKTKLRENVPLIVVAVSAFAGALRNLLIQQNVNLPKVTHFVMALPLPGAHPGDFGFCNFWTHGIFKVNIAEPDPLKRLINLHDNFKEKLDNRWPLVYHSLIVPWQSLLPTFAWNKITKFQMGVPNGSTNMIGPAHKVFLGGREVLHKYAYVGLLWKHSNMTAGFFSYIGQISATLVVNRNVINIPDEAQNLMDSCLQQEIKSLISLD